MPARALLQVDWSQSHGLLRLWIQAPHPGAGGFESWLSGPSPGSWYQVHFVAETSEGSVLSHGPGKPRGPERASCALGLNPNHRLY